MMRVLVFLIIGAGLSAFQIHHADFSGRWRLDVKKSKDLPPSFKSVESYTMEITQSPDSMTEQRQMKGAGQVVDFPPTVYKFDGSEVYREDTTRGSKRWIKSSWTTTGQKLIVTSNVVLHQRSGEQRFTQTDVWQFGKKNALLLLVTQKFEKNDSTHSEERVFYRMR
jgi:hypothetical protein